jgi:micrococcal nuclease
MQPSRTVIPDCVPDQTPISAQVVSVIDGDTITVRINQREVTVRYLGLDTPEMGASDPIPGRKAKERNLALVGYETVTLYRGNRDEDDFGRLLRFVIVEDGFVNRMLIQEGLASSFNRPHDDTCADLFTEDMLMAYQNRLGIWEDADSEYIDGEALCPEGCNIHLSTCNIKGNITSQADYIYHLPSSPDYRDVKIQPEKGERWFCTLDEAIANGWRPARQE